VVGVSTDDHKTQCEFASQLGVPYPMIADDVGTIAHLYDVVWPFLGKCRRVTYLLDDSGVIRGVFNHELMIDRHRDRVLDTLRKMRREAPPV
jgi:thioredoxin-dependent peroxiredoxin